MNKIAVFKKAVTLVVTAGVSKIVNDIIANNVEIEHSYQQVTVPVASLAIGGAVGELSSEYTDSMIDQGVEYWNEFKKRVKKTDN